MYDTQRKPSLKKKEGRKKDRSEIYAAIDTFAEEIKSGLDTWCKAGFTLLLQSLQSEESQDVAFIAAQPLFH